jgi:hypothetical protein
MKFILIKLFIGLVLFGTLVALTFNDVPNSGRLLDFCYCALMGLGVMHLGSGPQEGIGVASPDKQGGFASPFMLAFMGALALSMAACTSVSVQNAQVTYTQSCAAYGGAFDVMVALRKAGKLNQSQIDQVTIIDSQITPLCTGPLPQDLDAAAAQVTAAVTALTILETVK